LGDTAINSNSQILINGVEVPNTASGATIITAGDVATAVNQISDRTGVTASALTDIELTLDLAAYTATDNMSINGLAIAGDASTTIAELIVTVESTMAAAGSDIRAFAGSGSNNLRLTSQSGESITLLEIDANNDSNSLTAVKNLTTGNDLDEAGVSAGDIDEANVGLGIAATPHTFSGVITYTSTTGPIEFSHKQLGNNVLEGDAQTDLNILGVRLSDPHAASTSSTTTTGVDLSSAVNASAAITAIDTALSTVNTMRGDLGALQNRLEYTMNSLSQTVENHSASRSRAMDADFASESAALAKAQVLAQASTAMLAQANAAPQLALQLLQ
jgi:flagellin